MKHNNALPNNHFKKTALRYRTWFDQPARKIRRRAVREKKAQATFPMPLQKLKPIVRCPTMRYNTKQRLGRGFTIEECKGAELDHNYARTIGISVDARRRNMNAETFNENVERLKLYKSRLTFYETRKEARSADVAQSRSGIMQLARKVHTVLTVKIAEIDHAFPQ